MGIEELEKTEPINIEKILIDHCNLLINLEKRCRLQERLIDLIIKDLKFMTPEIKKLVEDLDGMKTYLSSTLIRTVNSLQSTKKKHYNVYT
jgi:hypothetical protein